MRKVFTAPGGVRAGPAICYEAVYGEYFTEFVRNGAQVMCVISNDGWWRIRPDIAICSLIRGCGPSKTGVASPGSANTGISGFIDQRGDVLQKLGWDQRGALTDSLSLNDRMTFYTRYGDVIGRVSSYVFVLGLLYFMAYRFRRKSHIVD